MKQLSTKKTNILYLIIGLVSFVIDIALYAYCMQLSDELHSRWKFDSAETMATIGCIILFFGLVTFAYYMLGFRTFADVYSDRIVGKGMQHFIVKDFDLSYSQITDVSFSGQMLYINTAGGKYKIVTNAQRAKEVFEYCNQIKAAAKQ